MEDISINAKWANRALRPLTSISRRLEKHQAKLSAAAESKHKGAAERNDAPTCTSIHQESRAENSLESDVEPEGNDPAWIPGTTLERRRARLKYSSRSENNAGTRRKRLSIHSPEAPRTLPGAIEVATPMITGKRWEMPSSAQSHRSTGPANTHTQPPPSPVFRGRNPRYKSLWQELLEQAGDEGLAHIAHNLDRVFQNFLLTTQKVRREVNPINQETRRGARSLMSMVMRRLPDFIAKEQEAQDDLDEDGDEDMCDAYFTELEAYYAPHGTGWEPLREAVRAQGVNLVARMIKHNWITDTIACALIEKSRSIAPDESDSLLSTLFSTRQNYPYPQALKPAASSDAPGDPILLLRKYAHHGVASRSYIFDELAKLLSRGVLPPEWMGTKPWTMWMTRATISFSRDDTDCPAASRLIEAVILSASNVRITAVGPSSWSSKQKRLPKGKAIRVRPTRAASTAKLEDADILRLCPAQVADALSNHVISLIAALCGIHISRSRDCNGIQSMNGPKASRIIGYLHFALQQDDKLRASIRQNDLTSHQLLRRGCILLATSLVQCNDAIIKQEHTTYASLSSIDSCASVITPRPDMIKELALLVQQAFRCLRTDSGNEPQRISKDIRRMVSELASVAETPAMCTFLGKVATEAAMSFAEATADPDDHVWAVEVQETVASSQDQEERGRETSEEPANSSQRNGLFRWEESIGEWVESTPAMKKTLHIAPKGRTPRMLSSPVPVIPCSTDCSSTESDDSPASSVTSSPPPVLNKRTFEDTDASLAQPNKRRRPTPVVVVENEAVSLKRASPATATPNPRVESATRREILRERSANLTRRIVPTTRQVPKVVIINSHGHRPSQRPVQRSPERGEKQIHRTVERRRSAYPSVTTPSNVRRRSSQQAVIPCSQDSDSDDELSFL
ncbi:hypothetical protein N7452_004992 [Penicillium brevicompactum]|uniref:Uncharacterized protein n=1 Tax=Penicillium brevicompactum TaxID=5074 RepID=A0A9W9QKL8_PENBR|nr:hypothetical protein N7452_004992 [Penicillium brevicompactum]